MLKLSYSNYYFAGSFGKFIGEIDAKVTISDCTAPEMTEGEVKALGFGDQDVLYEYLAENVDMNKGLDYYKEQAKLIGTAYTLQPPASPLISPLCTEGFTVTVDGVALVDGKDYNIYVPVTK